MGGNSVTFIIYIGIYIIYTRILTIIDFHIDEINNSLSLAHFTEILTK